MLAMPRHPMLLLWAAKLRLSPAPVTVAVPAPIPVSVPVAIPQAAAVLVLPPEQGEHK